MAFNRWNNDVVPEGLKRKKLQQTLFSFFNLYFESKLKFRKLLIDIIFKRSYLYPLKMGIMS